MENIGTYFYVVFNTNYIFVLQYISSVETRKKECYLIFSLICVIEITQKKK